MTKRTIWTLFAVAAAGITVYLVRNRRAKHANDNEFDTEMDHAPGKKRRKTMSAFSKEKSFANGDLNP